MNRDDIIRMARECGLTINDHPMLGVEHFAKLVAAAQREDCAWEVHRFLLLNQELVSQPMHFCDGIAAAIRGRGDAAYKVSANVDDVRQNVKD